MVTLIAASALSSTPPAVLAVLGPVGLSTGASVSLSALMIAVLAFVVIVALRKKTPPTIAEVLRGVDSPRTPQR